MTTETIATSPIQYNPPVDVLIPEQLQNDSFSFIRLQIGKKDPIDKWGNPKYQYEYDNPDLLKWLDRGGNYGILPRDDVCILDADDFSRLDELGALDSFKDSLTVRTGSADGEHYHFYFRCSGMPAKKIPFFDLTDDKVHLGELYPAGCSAYCVGPGCLHPSGNRYEIINDGPLKVISLEELNFGFFSKVKNNKDREINTIDLSLEQLERNRPEGSCNISDFIRDNGITPMDITPPLNPVKKGDEIEGVHPIHGSTNGHNWSYNTKTGEMCCRRCSSGTKDLIQLIALRLHLIKCEDLRTVEIRGDDYQACMQWLREQGYSPIIDEYYQYLNNYKRKIIDDSKYFETDATDIKPVDYLKLEVNLNKDNFISKYLTYWSKMTDSYPEYHIAGAITLLSTIADRRIFFDNSNGRLYTNFWGMILGRSSISRKSTAIKQTRELLTISERYHQLSGSFSPEGLTEELHNCNETRGSSHAVMLKDECADILKGINSKSYLSGLRDPLCRLYDCQGERRSLRSKRGGQVSAFNVQDPYLTFLWATTDDSFRSSTSSSDVSSGWLLRFLYFLPEYPKSRMGIRRKSDVEDVSYQALAEEFYKLSTAIDAIDKIEFMLCDSGYEIFNDWGEKKEAELLEKGIHASLFSRYEQYAMKLSALFYLGDPGIIEKLSTKPEFLQIPDEFIVESIRQIDEYYLPVGVRLIGDVSCSNFEGVQTKIVNALKTGFNYTLSKSDLLRKVVDIKAADMNEHLDTLEQAGRIKRFSPPKGESERKPKQLIQLLL